MHTKWWILYETAPRRKTRVVVRVSPQSLHIPLPPMSIEPDEVVEDTPCVPDGQPQVPEGRGALGGGGLDHARLACHTIDRSTASQNSISAIWRSAYNWRRRIAHGR